MAAGWDGAPDAVDGGPYSSRSARNGTVMRNDSYAATVLENLRGLESGPLLERVRAGSLTDEAHQLALQVLAERGQSVEGLPQVPPTEGPAESWWKPSKEEQLEQARRRRMFSLSFLLPCLPAFCALVASMAFHNFKNGSPLHSAVTILVVAAACIPSILALRRFAFRWGRIPQSEDDLRKVRRLWVLFAYPAYGITGIALLLAVAALFV